MQADQLTWTLEDATTKFGDKTLVVYLPRPSPPPAASSTAAPGRGWDNRKKDRGGLLYEPSKKGVRLFTDDEDEFGHEDVLCAMEFLEVGAVVFPRKPWEAGAGVGGVRVSTLEGLPARVRLHVESVLNTV